ncbi:MAG: cytochrome c [Gammaproteobacteria bacterium]|nr:cytochrome c [Gammaproteobacteria bacterium]
MRPIPLMLIATFLIFGDDLRAEQHSHVLLPALGTAPTADERARHDNFIFADGAGLPRGTGTVTRGQALYNAQCVSCHGSRGRGGNGGELAGGNPDLTAAQPDKNIGTYWPYAPPLFDFIRRSMPPRAPWSLSNADVYSLVAYLLNLNGLLAADGKLDAASLAAVKMPNRNGFVGIDARVN